MTKQDIQERIEDLTKFIELQNSAISKGLADLNALMGAKQECENMLSKFPVEGEVLSSNQ